MGTVSKSDLERWLQPFFEKEGLNNPVLTIEGNTEKGAGYLGDIIFIKLAAEKNNNKITYNFVIKTSKQEETIRSLVPINLAFKNEIYAYQTLWQIMKDFLNEKNMDDAFDNFPICYHTLLEDNLELLVLQNMKTLGYDLWARNKPMNKEHIRAVLQLYGRYHAISFALKDQKPKIFNQFDDNLVDIMATAEDRNEETRIKAFFEQNNDVIKAATKLNKIDIVEKIKQLSKRKISSLKDPSEPHVVVLHGDCWNNNFLFKYLGEKIENVCILDLQMSHVGPPVIDLCYFLLTCCDPIDLVENFAELNDCYYESLSEYVRMLGSDPDKVFPFEALMKQWKKYGTFGLNLLPIIMRFCLSAQEELKDLTDLKDNESSVGGLFTTTIKNQDEFGRRCLGPWELCIERDFDFD